MRNKLDEIQETLHLMPKWEDWEAVRDAILVISEQVEVLTDKILKLEEAVREQKKGKGQKQLFE